MKLFTLTVSTAILAATILTTEGRSARDCPNADEVLKALTSAPAGDAVKIKGFVLANDQVRNPVTGNDAPNKLALDSGLKQGLSWSEHDGFKIAFSYYSDVCAYRGNENKNVYLGIPG